MTPDVFIDTDFDDELTFDTEIWFDSDIEINIDVDSNFELDDGNAAFLTVDANAIGDGSGDDTLVEVNTSVLTQDNHSSVSLSVVSIVDDD